MVERVAVREVGGVVEVADGTVASGPAQDPVVGDVAPDQGVLVRHVDRTLRPRRPIRESAQDGVRRDETIEQRVTDDAFDGRSVMTLPP